MVSMTLWFFLVFTERKKILRAWWFYPMLFLPPIIFTYKQWTGDLISAWVLRPYGWRYVWSDSVWPILFQAYCLSFIGLGLLSLVSFWRKTSDPVQKRQSRIIFWTGASSFFLGVLTNIVFISYDVAFIPDIASVLVLIWALGLIYAIIRYKLLIFSPEEAYENIITTMADALILVDSNGDIITINNAALNLLDYKEDELKGQPLDVILPKEVAGAKIDEIVKTRLLKNFEFSLKSKSGKRIPVSLSSSTLKGQRGKKAGVIYIARDMSHSKKVEAELKTYREHLEEIVEKRTGELQTANLQLQQEIAEHKRTGKKLKESEEKYSSLFHQSSDALFVYDLDGNILEINFKTLDLFGFSKNEMLEKKITQLLLASSLDKFWQAHQQISGSDSYTCEVDCVKKTGEIFPAQLSSTLFELGEDRLIQGVVKDITEEKLSEKIQSVLFNIAKSTSSSESLHELLEIIHQELGTLMDTTNFYVALFDNKTSLYSFPYCVDEHEENETFSPQELKKSLTDYVRKTGKPLLVDEKKHQKLMEKGEVDLIGEPSQIWMGVPLKIPKEVIGVVALQSYRDTSAYTEYDLKLLSVISDQIATAIYRKQTQDQIKASLEEKEVLLKEVHHRVKNNMQIISSLLRLQSLEVKNKKVSNMFKVSRNRIKSMALIHESLYKSEDFSRIDFSEYISKLATHLYTIFCTRESRINVVQDVQNVSLDINRAIPCGLIINELISNSFRHAFEPNGNGKIHIKMSEKNGHYFLKVQDNGKGLPKNFDFQKSETLGLQVVNDLVKQLDGKISLDRNNGTTFTIKF
jgi:PAS domain S-box-containing protein